MGAILPPKYTYLEETSHPLEIYDPPLAAFSDGGKGFFFIDFFGAEERKRGDSRDDNNVLIN